MKKTCSGSGCRRTPELGYKTCSACRASNKRSREKRTKLGLCRLCPRPIDPGVGLCETHRVQARERSKKDREEFKKLIYDHYGGECACCGETEIRFMTVDHVENDGADHRRKLFGKNTGTVHRWLVKNKFPPGFQMLCFNCNAAKQFFGQCPHKD